MLASLPCGAEVGRLPPVGLNTVYLFQVLEFGAQVNHVSCGSHAAGVHTAPPFRSPPPSPLHFLTWRRGQRSIALVSFGGCWRRKRQRGGEPFRRSQGTGPWQTVPESGLLWGHVAQPWAVGGGEKWLKAFREAPLLGLDGVWGGEEGAGGWV